MSEEKKVQFPLWGSDVVRPGASALVVAVEEQLRLTRGQALLRPAPPLVEEVGAGLPSFLPGYKSRRVGLLHVVAACPPSGHDFAQAYTTCVPLTMKAAGTPWGTLEMFSFLAVWSRAVRVRVVSLA